jgi:hypothetical protein
MRIAAEMIALRCQFRAGHKFVKETIPKENRSFDNNYIRRGLMSAYGAKRTTPPVRWTNLQLANTVRKTHGQKINLNPLFRLRQIPASYHPPRSESAIAQTVNRTKMFHVKHFCPIGQKNRSKAGRRLYTSQP